jgi:uncharacterized Ntn-hydrolase superfamily protein
MTFSIVARQGQAYGVAVASKFLAVGSVVPAAAVGIGAVATQALARVDYLDELLGSLAGGESPQEALDAEVDLDEGRDHRQVGVVGASGAATYTGSKCMPWCGGVARETGDAAYAIQGNILTGPEVVEAMERAWLLSAGQPFARRLLAALAAGDAAGGDSRGRQSAAMYAVEPGSGYDHSGVLVDLRVDDHASPVTEIGRLLEEWELVFGQPEDVQPLEGALAGEVRERLAHLGFAGDDVRATLESWVGVVNYESRLSPEGIDGRVLDALRRATA